jgi:aminoglycoside phosphotransferase (APT) family kinase protein
LIFIAALPKVKASMIGLAALGQAGGQSEDQTSVNASIGKPETTAVREAHRFDEARLANYLAAHLPALRSDLSIRQFKAGQSNPTFLLETENKRYVLRKKPPGKLLPSAHMIEREYQVMAALGDTSVPVPRMRLLCEDPEIIGTAFYVMDHVEGRVYQDPRLPELGVAERGAIYRSIAETLALLHGVDWQAIGLETFGKPSDYIARQIRLWTRQYEAAKTGDIPEMDRLIAWLPENIPSSAETTIAHGDYRLGNLILHPTEPRVIAILDWELSTLGDPLSDLAYCCLPYYQSSTNAVLPGLADADLPALGIPDEAKFIASYFEARDMAPSAQWPFYVAFAFFRLTSIVQGVYARALQGNASAPNAIEYGDRAVAFAKLGWAQTTRSV